MATEKFAAYLTPEDFYGVLRPIAEQFGVERAVALAREFSNTFIYVPLFASESADLEMLDPDIAAWLQERYAGCQVLIPSISRLKHIVAVRMAARGMRIDEIARQLSCHRSTVYEWLRAS